MPVDMPVRIDEAGAYAKPPGVNRLRARGRGKAARRADFLNHAVFRQNIRRKASPRFRVDQGSAINEQLRHATTSLLYIIGYTLLVRSASSFKKSPQNDRGLFLKGAAPAAPVFFDYRESLKVVQISWNFCSSSGFRFSTNTASPMRSNRPMNSGRSLYQSPMTSSAAAFGLV